MKKSFSWLLAAILSSFASTASADQDITSHFIVNPSFENGTNAWTCTNLVTQSNSSFTKKSGTIYLEKWTGSGSVGCATVEQTLSYLPAGNYILRAAAQNIQQSSTSSAQTGAVIYAGTKKTTVTFAADYDVSFTAAGANVKIGFKATNATGNWICVDNFRLYYVSGDYTLLQTAITNAENVITKAELSSRADIQPAVKEPFKEVIAKAKAITEDADDETLTSIAFELAAAHKAAQENADALFAIKQACTKSNPFLTGVKKDMAKMYTDALQSVYDEAQKVLAFEHEADLEDLLTRLVAAREDADASYEAKKTLKGIITNANKLVDESKQGLETYLAAIATAESVRDSDNATPADMEAATIALEAAMLAFNIGNGSGAEPKATTVTSFIIPAAHGALIRASFSGSNITERGICWSTNRDPKVTDHRSTTYHTLNGNIYQITDMEPASVYYARAYAITRTYAVGYGDVVKVVTLPEGSCVGTWDGGAPSAEANERCSTAIQQTMDYLNEWTAIQGFHLSGHYGASTPTADCSYGGYMRIGPNAGNQAIGTVIHETGHGVGVGTHWRWYSCADTRESTTYGKWLGSWANKTLQFLENNYGEGVFFTGDKTHGWGANASYDWLVNGSDKDKHLAIQYIGGCAILYALYVDGLCPTSGYPNGVPGYTFDFDETKKYYIKCEDSNRGLYDGFLCQRGASYVSWKQLYSYELDENNAAWYIEFEPKTGYYFFKNAATGRYLSHPSAMSMVNTTTPGANQRFQLMPGRNELTINEGESSVSVPSYWFAWNNNGNKAMALGALSKSLNYGSASVVDFDYSNSGGTMQRYVLISEDDLEAYQNAALPTGIRSIPVDNETTEAGSDVAVYSIDGRLVQRFDARTQDLRSLALPRGIYIIGGKKVVIK